MRGTAPKHQIRPCYHRHASLLVHAGDGLEPKRTKLSVRGCFGGSCLIYLRLEEDGPPVTFALRPGVPSTIGREADNDIVVKRLQVSRQHARVRVLDGSVQVEDLSSHNGTQVQRVTTRKSRKGAERWLPVPLADDQRPGSLSLSVGDRLRLGGPGGPVLVVAEAVPSGDAPPEPAPRKTRRADPMATVSTLDVTEDGGSAQLEFLRSMAALSWTTPTSEARRDALLRLQEITGADRVDLLALQSSEVEAIASSVSASFEHAGHVQRAVADEQGRPAGLTWVALERGRVALLIPAARHFAACFEFREQPRFSPQALCGLDAIVQIACPWLALSLGVDDLRAVAPELAARAQAWERARLREPDDDLLVSASAAMRRVRDEAIDAAESGLPVLLTGETGVGKEVVARLIHARSSRRASCFVPLDCGAIPGELFEGEFFGWVRGAFVGAHADTAGLFEVADGGTLFLDEIGNLALTHQAKLLRALQEGEFRRVGDRRLRRADVRLIAATNVDLEACISSGAFRPDLFYRVAAVRIAIPPLRERREDVLPLAESTLARLAREGRTSARSFDVEARRWLQAERWPGNVRQLQARVSSAAARATGVVVTLADFTPQPRGEREQPLADLLQMPLERAQAEFRSRYLAHLLAACGGNKTRAARHAGVDVRTIREMARRLESEECSGDEGDDA